MVNNLYFTLKTCFMEENSLVSVNNQLFHAISAGDDLPHLSKQEEKEALENANKLSLRFMRDAIRAAGVKSMSLLVHMAQGGVYALLNYVHRRQMKNKTKLLSNIQDALTRFMYLLKDDFTGYFDHSYSMPKPVWLSVKEKLLVAIGPGEDSVFEGMEHELVDVVKNSLEEVSLHKIPNFIMADYWTLLLEKVRTTLPGSGNTTLRAIFTLIAYNFNSGSFMQYIADRYMAALPQTGNALEQWNSNLLHLNRVIEVPGYALFTDHRSCKQSLTDLMKMEIAACAFTKEGEERMVPKPFLNYTISVPQLAMFTRIQVEAGMLETDNITDLIKRLSLHCSTKRTGNVSDDSLLRKYYRTDRATISILLDYNAKMHNLLKSYLV